MTPKNFGLTLGKMALVIIRMGKAMSKIRALVLAMLLQMEMLYSQLGIRIWNSGERQNWNEFGSCYLKM